MKKLFPIVLLLILAGCAREEGAVETGATSEPAVAMEETFVPAGEMTALSPDGAVTGYVSLPIEPDPAKPALILIHEWWGLNDWIKENADRYAAKGYVVIAPDLYRGSVATTADDAHQLMRALPEDRAMADMHAAFDWLEARDDVDSARIGITGWCMGGGYSLAFGTAEPRLAAVSLNYGKLITDPDKVARIDAPVLGIFGGQDKGILVEDVKAFEQTLEEKGIENEIRIFESSGHAFMNPNNEGGFDQDATKEAWELMDAFFARELKAGVEE